MVQQLCVALDIGISPPVLLPVDGCWVHYCQLAKLHTQATKIPLLDDSTV